MHRDNARRTGPALERMQQFLVWLVPTVEKFPRSQKFLLGDRILFRLAAGLPVLDLRRYGFAARSLEEVGRVDRRLISG